jgi:glucosamine-6-phosphate deaminase
MWTISALQLHPKGMIVCDESATYELTVGTYKHFKYVEKNHLDPKSLLESNLVW